MDDQEPASESPPKTGFSWKRWLLIGVGVLIVISIIGSLLDGGSDDENQASTNNEETIPNEVDVTESSRIIARLYSENEVGAEIQFTGKWADITGPVYKIDERGDFVEVSLRNTVDIYPEIVCKIASSQRESVAQLLPGNRLTVRGKILGVPGFINIVVEPCIILPE